MRGHRRTRVYRKMVEQRIGRPLGSHEVVHHIDGNYCNDHPDNLLALSSQSAHVRVHMFELREEQGSAHLFPLEVLLESCLDSVVWVSPAGARAVFGEEAGALIAAEVQRRYAPHAKRLSPAGKNPAPKSNATGRSVAVHVLGDAPTRS